MSLLGLVNKSFVLQRAFSALSNSSRVSLVGQPSLVQARFSGTYFNHRPAKELWKSVTMVSNQGRQRGRAKGLLKIKNLHKGQKLGMGPARISFPGLTIPALNAEKVPAKIGEVQKDAFEKYEQDLKEIRAMAGTRRGLAKKQSPLERGWAGSSPQGRKFGKPLTQNPELNFDDFDSILIEYRTIIKMSGKFGRTRQLRLLMVTGNGKGTAGFSLTRSAVGRGPNIFHKGVNKAGLRLMNVDLYEGRTIYHDFFTQFGQTRVFAQQKPEGHGVKAHRVIKAICDLVGIKDIHCTLEGSHNPLHITKSFFLGLLRQRTHQMLANEKQLHLVELREENDNFPKVVASPENGYIRTKEEINPNESLDFELISYDGQIPYYKATPVPFWERLPSFQIHLKKKARQTHHKLRRHEMLLYEGRIASHLTDKFPECVPPVLMTKKMKQKLAEQNSN